MKGLRKSYFIDARHGELYTGGPVSLHPALGLLLPQQSQLNTLSINNPNLSVSAIVGDESRIVAVSAHPTNGRVVVAFASDMVRAYEPTLAPTTAKADEAEKIVGDLEKFTWTEVSHWRCQLVQWMAWDTVPGNANPLVACASADSTVKVFDQVGQFCSHNFRGHVGPVTFCRFEPPMYNKASDSKKPQPKNVGRRTQRFYLYTSGQDCTIKVWDLMASKLVTTLTNHLSPVTEIDFVDTPQGRRIVSVSRDKMLNVWDATDFKLLFNLPIFETLESVVILPNTHTFPRERTGAPADSIYALTAGEKGRMKIWNLASKSCVYEEPDRKVSYGIDYVVFDKAANQLIAVANDQNIIIYDAATMNIKQTVVGFNDEIVDMKFLTNTEVAVATNSEQVRIFSLPNFGVRVLGQGDSTAQHSDTVLALATSHDGKYIVSASKDQRLIVWEVATGKSKAVLTGHAGDVSAVTFFRQNHRYIISAGRDLTWKLWDIKAAIEHEGDEVVAIKSSVITVKAHDKDINAVAMSPNDTILASASQDKTIKLFRFNAISQLGVQEIGVLRGHRRGVWDIAFSPVDQVLVSTSGDKTLKLWSVNDFSCIKTFEGHTGTVLRVAFITRGLQLLSAGADGLIKIWNIHNNECVNTFDKHTEKIWGFAVAEDGASFVSGGGDSVINYWKDNTVEETEKELKAQEEIVLAEQNLVNSLRSKDYRKALRIAFHLEKPARILQILETIITESDSQLRPIVADFTYDQVEKCLLYIRDWNTNAKHSLVAQRALNEILSQFSAESLGKLPRIKEFLQALIPYTQRHFQRVDKLVQKSFIIDYTLQAMQILDDMAIDDDIKTTTHDDIDNVPKIASASNDKDNDNDNDDEDIHQDSAPKKAKQHDIADDDEDDGADMEVTEAELAAELAAEIAAEGQEDDTADAMEVEEPTTPSKKTPKKSPSSQQKQKQNKPKTPQSTGKSNKSKSPAGNKSTEKKQHRKSSGTPKK